MRIIFYLLFLTILFSSCEEKEPEKNTQITGIVTNKETGQRIDGATVRVRNTGQYPEHYDIQNLYPYSSDAIIVKAKTNSNGEFDIEMRNELDRVKVLVVYDTMYISTESFIIESGKANHFEVEVNELLGTTLKLVTDYVPADLKIDLFNGDNIEINLDQEDFRQDTSCKVFLIKNSDCIINMIYKDINQETIYKDTNIIINESDTLIYLDL